MEGKRYSLEQAQAEAAEIQEKIKNQGFNHPTAEVYKETEAEVELEGMKTLEPPAEIKTVLGRAERLWNEVYKEDEGLRSIAQEKARIIYEGLKKEAGLEEKYEEWRQQIKKDEGAALPLVRDFVERVYNGEEGEGRLTIIFDWEGNPELIRVLPLTHDKKRLTDWLKTGVLDRYAYVLTIKPGTEAGFGYKNDDPPNPFDRVKGLVEQAQFNEVNLGKPSQEELNGYFTKLVAEGVEASVLFRAFPKNYETPLEDGEELRYGSRSHHSGDIYGRLIVLPGKRFAVVSSYSGENERYQEPKVFWGILKNKETQPDWSARAAEWKGPKLEKPSDEEIQFVKERGFTYFAEESKD